MPERSKRKNAVAFALLGGLVFAPALAMAAPTMPTMPTTPATALPERTAAAARVLKVQYQQRYGQPQQNYGQPPQGYNQPPQGYSQPPQRYAQRPPSVDRMLGELRQRLRLRGGQVAAFHDFAEVMRQNAREARSVPPPNRNAGAVEALRAELRFTRAEVRGLQRLLPALRRLYATLYPSQRRTANAFFRAGPGAAPQR